MFQKLKTTFQKVIPVIDALGAIRCSRSAASPWTNQRVWYGLFSRFCDSNHEI